MSGNVEKRPCMGGTLFRSSMSGWVKKRPSMAALFNKKRFA